MPPSNEKKEGILPSTTSVVAPSALRLTTLERLKANYRSHRKFLLILITYLAVRVVYEGYNWVDAFGIGDNGPRCPQADTLTPDKNANLWTGLNKKIGTPAFETSAINWLAGAVRVPLVNSSSCL
jgi:Gly-Xaa carboxypeptidase